MVRCESPRGSFNHLDRSHEIWLDWTMGAQMSAENDCLGYLDQSLDGFDDRCTEGKGHKDSVAYAAIAQAHALCRIADALEKLVSVPTPESLPPVPDTSLKPRCPHCQGTGLFHGLGTFCDCQTGKDLERQQKKAGHIDA
jgi:hypothetical protein